MLLFAALLSCSALVAAAPLLPNKKDLILSPHIPRLTDNEVLEKQSTQCWQQWNLQWPMADMPPPCKDVAIPQRSLYKVPQSKPQTLTVVNHCPYDIAYKHWRGASAVPGVLKAGATWNTPTNIGTAFKASKVGAESAVVMVEYNVVKETNQLWYNLSLIECLKKDSNGVFTKDASQCVGIEAGYMLGNSQKSFQCGPNEWCDNQLYLYPENMCKTMNPVGVVDASLGITMEFCASHKK